MKDFGFSDCMGPQLREFVEQQLLIDLCHYLSPEMHVNLADFSFDWSDSCIEGHRASWLDGAIENFSGIVILDPKKNVIVEGWMDFVETDTGLEVFWWSLHGRCVKTRNRARNEVPSHIWDRLSDRMCGSCIKSATETDN
ncbi:hypothetical protein CES85_3401 (plasmid) [Ochrobactrum quorumnocens]|uniref:Uncharacterized protein n=1 Tax=Ochrobactrum quorumnocens TaxID=271865 RepID=A0A248UPE9_9HYPH|nr:hypothetical protein [[Ochrobactrum] quorumnocens]ASV88568.1 hypothetical protein CES85_3401 [[Ochrobactrum] quorumnocens]